MQVNTDALVKAIHEQPDPIIQSDLINRAVEQGVRIIQIANELDTSSSYICHLKRLKKLPEIIINGYYDKIVSLSHLFIISRLHDMDDMVSLYETVLAESLSTQQTEKKVFELLSGEKNDGNKLTKEWFMHLEDEIRSIDAAITVSSSQTRRQGEIVIKFKGSLQETGKVFEKIKLVLKKDS